MADSAVQTKLAGVDFVRERHRLSRLIAHAGVFRSEVVSDAYAHAQSNKHDGDAYLERKPVGPARKKVAHKLRSKELVKNFTRKPRIGLAQSPRNRRNKIFEKIPPPSAGEGNSPSVPAVFQPVFLAKKTPLQPPNLKSPAALDFQRSAAF
jgi:hypothetical protein